MAQDAPGTTAARREVLRARAELESELDRLGVAARDAADIKAQVRRSPGKVAAVAGGAGFLALGGPKRVLRGVKRAVFGRPDPLPSRLLPEEVDRVVRSLGEDGAKVQGVLEREFAAYLKEKRKADKRFWRDAVVGSLVVPAARTALSSAVRRALAEATTDPTDGGGAGARSTGAGAKGGTKGEAKRPKKRS